MKSESLKELASALAKAQGQMKGALKDSDNPYFKSKYADLTSVVEAIRRPLSDNGLSYVQITHDKPEAAAIETVVLHASGEWMSCGTVCVPVTKADAQGFGSAMTYARRYGLSAAFGVAPEDDDGNAAAKAKPAPKKTTTEVWDSLSSDEQGRLQLIADCMRSELTDKGPRAAVVLYLEESLGADETVALWSRFDSKERAAMKAAKQQLDSEKTGA